MEGVRLLPNLPRRGQQSKLLVHHAVINVYRARLLVDRLPGDVASVHVQ